MTREKQDSKTEKTVQATPEETELNKLLLERARAAQGGQIQVQESGLNLINQLLTGGELPGGLSGLTGGISEDVTSRIVQESLGDVRGGLQAQGLFDSGVRAELETETAANIRTQSEQFNIQNLQQLLNLAVGGQAQIQAPLAQQSSQLGGQLAGLRSTSSNVQNSFMNPFLKSFEQSFGKSLGSGSFGGGGNPEQAGQAAALFGGCWVASEIFGGWTKPKTCNSRNFVNNISPKWFKKLYLKYGQRIAGYISDKPILKNILRPLFELFSWIGGR